MAYLHFKFFRFSMSLHEPSDFCLINIGKMYSPVSCSHFFITPFAKTFEFLNLSQTHLLLKIEEYRSYVLLVAHTHLFITSQLFPFIKIVF